MHAKHNVTVALVAVSLVVPSFALAQSSASATLHASVQAGNSAVNVQASTTLSAAAAATAKSRADKEIDRRSASLGALAVRVQSMTRVTADFKTQLSAALQAQLGALATLKAKIDADTDTPTLKADIHSITDSYRIYRLVMPQIAIAAAADRIVNVATMESALGAKLKARVDAAGSSDAALTAALADLAAKTSAAVTQAQAAMTASQSLTADNGDKTIEASNTASLQASRQDLQQAQQDLVAARKDITAIMQGLKSLSVSASASSTVQTR